MSEPRARTSKMEELYAANAQRAGRLAYFLVGDRELARDLVLPLDYDGLEKWEEWLKATHPEDAARYLNPRATEPGPCADNSCHRHWDSIGGRMAPLLWDAKKEWSIKGFRFRPTGLIPYDPAFADEIEASIQAYLGDR